jgi:hypothetical protein
MSKKTVFLFLGLGLAAALFADLGLSVSFLSSEHVTTFTSQAIWNKGPQPSFRDTLLVLSSFQPNRKEFLVFGNIISGKGVPIENGMWDTKKTTLGMGFGKVLTIPVALPKIAVAFALDFSAGPFVTIFLSNRYTHVGGKYMKEVEEASILQRVQYGLYATSRLRLQEFKKYLHSMDASIGLHFFMPFSNHEHNDDPKARYHLFKTFLCAGISF